MPVETDVKMSEDLRELHPLIRAFYKHSKKMPAIDSGKVSAEAAYKAGAWVSHKHLRRAILILDAVVSPGRGGRGCCCLECLCEVIYSPAAGVT